MTHPITPPPELVQQWRTAMTDAVFEGWKNPEREKHLCVVAAQWGADQELEACLRLVEIDAGEDAYDFARYIRAARRHKPKSLKEQALAVLETEPEDAKELIVFDTDQVNIIRRALEQLDD
jgi:predicted GNAT family N-acyltransferase